MGYLNMLQASKNNSHLAVIIRQIKDDELLKQEVPDNSLVVGRGRLSEAECITMLRSMR